jgi:SAM-dependent methyltransferase
MHDEKEWSFEALRKFWVSDNLSNIKPGNFGEFPEGFDPRKVLSILRQLVGSGCVTELGCGYGRLCSSYSAVDYRGFDINPLAINKARECFPGYRFDVIDDPHDLPGGVLLLAYTVFLHMPNSVLIPWIETAKRNYEYILVSEILGRDWRETAGTTPVFNRDLKDYIELIAPFKLVTEIRVPYQRYVNSHFASLVKSTDISFLLFRQNGVCPSGLALDGQ